VTYDSSGRIQYKWLCAGGVTTSFCTGGTQLYGFNTAWKGSYLMHGIDTTENSGGDYTYDALGHMTAYTGTQGQPTSYSYTYDRYGNRLSATPGASITVNKSYNTIAGGGFYDDALGNQTSDSVHTYSYDAENNLTSVDGGSTATYFYNALNQRVEISNAQGSHEFTYDFAGRRIATWLPGTNSGIQGQIWWGSTPIAYRDATTYFQQADWVGTQRLLTDYTGSVVSAYTSRPWGEAYVSTGQDDNISHYAGLEQSENTGIQHAQFRDYDSSLGRWLSPDSYTGSYDFTNPQSFNRFSYAGNAPNGNTDPSGQMFIYTPSPGGTGRGGVYFAVDPNEATFGSTWTLSEILGAAYYLRLPGSISTDPTNGLPMFTSNLLPVSWMSTLNFFGSAGQQSSPIGALAKSDASIVIGQVDLQNICKSMCDVRANVCVAAAQMSTAWNFALSSVGDGLLGGFFQGVAEAPDVAGDAGDLSKGLTDRCTRDHALCYVTRCRGSLQDGPLPH
jgi:RHS repeat-associated protein